MPGATILEVVLGLVLMYLLLALFCTVINEWVTTLLASRARNLEVAVRQLLQDPDFTEQVLRHPLLQVLGDPRRRGKKGLVVGASYIPPMRFAAAVLEILKDSAGPAQPAADVMLALRNKIETLPNSLRRSLRALLDEAQGDVQAFKTNLGRWYDEMMERAGGWYKRRISLILFVVGIALAILCNADSVMVTRILWQDQARRVALAGYAEQIAAQDLAENQQQMAARIRDDTRQLWGPLPIGWRLAAVAPDDTLERLRMFPGDPIALLLKVFGVLLTAVATSLGAPFWFDLLQKVTQVRAAGSAPPTSSSKEGGFKE